MKVTVLYNGVPSMVCASSLVKSGIDAELLAPYELTEAKSDGFKLFPYELPIVGVNHRDYENDLFPFLGLDELRKYFLSEKDVINVVFGHNRVDFSSRALVEDISRIFPDYVHNVASFLSEIKTIEKKLPVLWLKNKELKGSRKKNIIRLYDKHKLPPSIRVIFDAVLFVVSGSLTEEIPFIEAVRIITSALEGVNSSDAGIYSLTNIMMKTVSAHMPVVHFNDAYTVNVSKEIVTLRSENKEETFLTKEIIIDGDLVKKDFVSNFNQFNSRYSSNVRYPMSMFFKFDAKNIPTPMSRCLIYVDLDESGFYSSDDVYVVRYMLEGEKTYLRITTFVPYGIFDINSEGHREKLFVMRHIVEDLVPSLSTYDYDCYPDPKDVDLKNELEHMFSNLFENDLVYGNIYDVKNPSPLYKKILSCGRESFYPLGFESSVISGLSAMNKFVRSLKKS